LLIQTGLFPTHTYINQSMIQEFTKEHLDSIAGVLGAGYKTTGQIARFDLSNNEAGSRMVLEIHLGLQLEKRIFNMVSVYAHGTFLQLHNCTGFITSDILHQVTFFGKTDNQTTGLIIEREGGCSLYANVDESLLKGDFTKLPPEVMMCSVALSLTESIDSEGFTFDE
jgi:hypothetical protein